MFSEEVRLMTNIISGIIIGVSGPLILSLVILIAKNIKRDRGAHNRLTEGLVALQKDRFVEMYYKVREQKGVRLYQRDILEDLHKSYHDLGGNSYIDKIMDEISHMPTLD